MSSLKTFQTCLRPSTSEASRDPRLLDVYIALYDTLIDDDDEVREEGARIVSWTLSSPCSSSTAGPNMSLSPIAATALLLQFLKEQYKDSIKLFDEGLSRLLSQDRRKTGATRGHLIPVKSLLEVSMEEDNSLFIEEKQNLYMDEVQEVERWADLLCGLDSPTVHARVSLPFIGEWAFEGLEALKGGLEYNLDGFLGWTSNPQVFTLGMRVFLTLGVVIRHGYGANGNISRALTELLALAEHQSLHCLWSQRLKGIAKGRMSKEANSGRPLSGLV